MIASPARFARTRGCGVWVAALAAAAVSTAAPELSSDNPFAQASTLPLQYPRFDRIQDAHFTPAFAAGMARQLEEVAAIADNPEKPTFENTLVALERSGELLDRVNRTFSNLMGTVANDARRAIEKEITPKLAAHSDAIRLNAALFARLGTLYANRAKLALDPESDWLLERYYKDFVRAGAKLADADKTKLKALNQEIASLQTAFTQNVQKGNNAAAVGVETREELAGMTEGDIAAAAAAAKSAGKDGKYLIEIRNTTGQPPLTYLQNRVLRQRIYEASSSRNQSGEWDNRPIVARLIRLRAERAQLLGYATHADYQLEDQTAGSVAVVNKLLAELAPPAVANARKEGEDIQAVIDRENGGFKLAPWDWDFYSEKVRRERYAFDQAELKPYFELDRVLRDGVFFAATKLYGITFRERHDLPVYEPSVQVFDVFEADGSPLAIFISDNYARPSKRGGAWMNSYVVQSKLLGRKPVVANHLNLTKPAEPGAPTLMTPDEVITLFHEFGHALHGMFSAVNYPRFTGTAVPRDFVEYPSQVNEMWATWPEVLKNYARHYKTGEPLPEDLMEKVMAVKRFNQGFRTTEYLAASLLDQTWHQLKPSDVPPPERCMEFEAEALRTAGVDFAPVPPRYRTPYFLHIFHHAYSAGYYSYLWSEVLDADSVEWFKENGGLSRKNGDHFRQTLLSRGGSREAMSMFREFRGAPPKIDPLLERRGLTMKRGAASSP